MNKNSKREISQLLKLFYFRSGYIFKFESRKKLKRRRSKVE